MVNIGQGVNPDLGVSFSEATAPDNFILWCESEDTVWKESSRRASPRV